MRVIVILISFIIGCVLSTTVDESHSDSFYPFKDATFSYVVQGRIINGDRAADGQFPWQVYVIATNGTTTQFTCGGSILSPEWILTAAHCVYHSLKFEIGYGTNRMRDAAVIRPAFYTHVHPKYNPRNLNNDIALIKVSPAVILSDQIQAIRLPDLTQIQEKYVGAVAVVSGWGRTAHLSSSVALQYTNAKIIRNSACAVRYRSIVIESTICAVGAASKRHNICYGDSGGPLVTQGNGVFVQIGIVSFVSGTGCTTGHPAGYARITSFRKWINDVTGL